MKHEPTAHHIESIFQALDVGLDGLTEMPGNSFTEVSFTPPTLPLGNMPPVRVFTHVRIDGHEYRITVEPNPDANLGDD